MKVQSPILDEDHLWTLGTLNFSVYFASWHEFDHYFECACGHQSNSFHSYLLQQYVYIIVAAHYSWRTFICSFCQNVFFQRFWMNSSLQCHHIRVCAVGYISHYYDRDKPYPNGVYNPLLENIFVVHSILSCLRPYVSQCDRNQSPCSYLEGLPPLWSIERMCVCDILAQYPCQ